MKMSEAIKEYNKHGGHFFDTADMEFWGSSYANILLDDYVFFTREDNFDRSEKYWSIRRFTEDYSSITTLSWQKHSTLEDAISDYFEVYKDKEDEDEF